MSPAMQTEERAVAQLFRQENLHFTFLEDAAISGDIL
jgi:hypothetical protein